MTMVGGPSTATHIAFYLALGIAESIWFYLQTLNPGKVQSGTAQCQENCTLGVRELRITVPDATDGHRMV